ncbi:MAG: putative glycoside hydrolase [Armatimonadota bacterium]
MALDHVALCLATPGLLLAISASSALTAPVASGLRCEWVAGNPAVHDPYPELYWETDGQQACQVQVARTEADLPAERNLQWDSGRLDSRLPIVEYAGPALENRVTYFWRVRLWDADGTAGPWSETQRFTTAFEPLPALRPHIRCFVNFGSADAEMMAGRYDVSFRSQPNELRPEYIGLAYSLMATMVVPSSKHDDLAAWCVEQGLSAEGVPEEMFCHYRADTAVTLHVGAENAANPRETRTIPGWDPANDRNGDGVVNDAEAANPANPNAHARTMSQARIPMYYWGPPRDDYTMNIGHPHYQRYLAERYMPAQLAGGYDGFVVDTTPPTVPGARGAAVLEYPDDDPGGWMRDMQMAMARVKIALPDSVLTANGWSGTPFVLDGMEAEGWLDITRGASALEARLRAAIELDRRGKIQLLQFNPIYVEGRSEFGPKVPIDLERDAIFGLAAYYLCAGERTYYGYGRHPYGQATSWYFPAIEFDVGAPLGEYERIVIDAPEAAQGRNLLPNGDFEADADGDGLPDGWETALPLALDEQVVHSGRRAVRIDSDDAGINNLNKGWVTLRPNTTYTLSGWMKTLNVSGGHGAQLYLYDFEGAQGTDISIIMHGTTDWTQVRQVFRTGDDAEGRVTFRIYGATGTAWFDDLRITEGAAAEQVFLTRRFQRALVVVRPAMPAIGWGDDTAVNYPLPASYRPLRADGDLGDAAEAVTLRLGEAAILVPVVAL